MILKEKFSLFATCVILLLVACVSVQAQQQTPTPANSSELTTGAIEGRVVNEGGQPLPGAVVFIRPVNSPGTSRNATTDSEGNFRLGGLEPALYTVGSYFPAYVIQLAETEPTVTYYRIGDSVNLQLIRGGVVTGVVTNPAGEPIVGIRVRASMIRNAKGQPARGIPGAGLWERTTDDRGIYRIYGLAPGTYLISAGGSGASQSFQLNPYDSDTPTYAPSSTRDNATEFIVRSGEDTTADIRYRSDPGHTISGTVKVAANNGAQIALMPVEGNFMPSAGAFQPPGGRGFALGGVGDGDYIITAQEIVSSAIVTMPELGFSEGKRVTVRGADITGVELIPKPLASVSGRVTLEPSKAAECKGKRQPLFAETLVHLQRHEKDGDTGIPFFQRMYNSSASPDPKGAFVLRNVSPGRYRFNPRFYARYWYLQSISLGAPVSGAAAKPSRSDAAASWTTVKSGEQLGNLTITLAEGAASIRGRLVVAEGAAVPSGVTVYLVPAERDKADDVLRYFVAEISADGTFALNNLPPGRYSLLQSPIDTATSTLIKLRLPEAAEARTKLRRIAETQKTDIELKPCQTVTDYQLSIK
jgi:hypothetical protein